MKIFNKLAFKITASVGLLFIVILFVVYTSISVLVIYEFEGFFKSRHSFKDETTILSIENELMKHVSGDKNVIDKKELQYVLQNYSDWQHLLIVLFDVDNNIIATNQALYANAQMFIHDNELNVISDYGIKSATVSYVDPELHKLKIEGLWFYVLPFDQSPELIAAEEGFRVFLSKKLLVVILISTVIGLLIIWLIISKYIKRLASLTDATLSVQDGGFPEYIEPSGNDELTGLTKNFNKAFDRLKEQEILRDNMISDVAHELRTPLTHMRCNAEAVIDDVMPADKTAFININHEINYLTRIVNDLQDLTLAKAGTLSLYNEDILVFDEVSDILQAYRNKRGQKNGIIKNSIEPDTILHTDRTRFKQIMINLLDNAFKYSDGDIVITIMETWDNNQFGLIIKDNGAGIPPCHIDQIFERAKTVKGQVDRSSLGLGLAIVKHLADIQKISINVMSEPGNTIFYLWFPLDKVRKNSNGD